MYELRALGERVERHLSSALGIYVAGLLLVVAGALATPYHFRGEPLTVVLFYGFVDVVMPACVLLAGVHLTRTRLGGRDIGTVTRWVVAGATTTALLFLWSRLDHLLSGTGFASIHPDLALYANVGAVAGLLVGVNRARAAQNERLLERTAAQQEALEFINHLLRHNVLNGLQVVDGYADLMEGHVDTEAERYLVAVQERNDHMADLIANVRVLMRTLADGVECVPVDASLTIEQEVSVAAAGHPEATFETDVPMGLTVLADATLGAVLENLLTNAVVHSDRPNPNVAVTAVEEDGAVVVRVSDDGPGVPESLHSVYLREGEQSPTSTGDGLGLYLASTLVEAYGGTFTIGDNEPRGATFELRLRSAEAVTAGGTGARTSGR